MASLDLSRLDIEARDWFQPGDIILDLLNSGNAFGGDPQGLTLSFVGNDTGEMDDALPHCDVDW
jgi:hypothetical protein